MKVSAIILPLLEEKIRKAGFQTSLHLETHDDAIPIEIKKISPDWKQHIANFE